MPMPDHPKIYHICHVDRLPSIVASEGLLSDAVLMQAPLPGTVIGMSHIKQRRLTELRLNSHPQLFVGQCVPFYFCPRSVYAFFDPQGEHRLGLSGWSRGDNPFGS